jgi:hypothetical protein
MIATATIWVITGRNVFGYSYKKDQRSINYERFVEYLNPQLSDPLMKREHMFEKLAIQHRIIQNTHDDKWDNNMVLSNTLLVARYRLISLSQEYKAHSFDEWVVPPQN